MKTIKYKFMHSYALNIYDACNVLIAIEFCEMILLNIICNINMLDPIKVCLSYLVSRLILIPRGGNFQHDLKTRYESNTKLIGLG